MKITKTFASIFLATFFIGFVFVQSMKKEVVLFEPDTKIAKTLLPTVIISQPEILEEDNDWREDDESKFKIKLIETGEGFHGDQIKAKSGETWLGLFKENDNYFLLKTKIRVHRFRDDINDEPNEMIEKSVSVNGKSQPIFLLKNADMLQESKVKTLFYNSSDENLTSLSNGFAAEYQLNDKKYILRVKGGANSSKLILENENSKQILFSLDKMGDTTWELIWVGDIDGDGKLDLYANLPTFYNFSEKRLFLSSQAENGKLIQQVANFWTSGC